MGQGKVHVAVDKTTYILGALQHENILWDRGVAVRVRFRDHGLLALCTTLQKDNIGMDE